MTSHKKPKRRRIDKFRLDETSVVDQPAQIPARIAIMKRKVDTPDVEIQKNRLAMTTLTAGHSHSIILMSAHSEGLAELKAGQTSFADGHTHDWIMDESGNFAISEADGHSHGINALLKAADDVTNETLTEDMLASLGQDPTPASTTKAAESGAETTIMSPEEQAAFEKEAKDQLNIEKARGDRAEQIVKLSPDQRSHYDALPEGEQDEFLASDSKDSIVKNATDADPVVHTDLDGNEFRKSTDATVLRLVKSNDELRKTAAKSEALSKRASFEKQASDELGHLTGDDSAKADLVEAVDSLPLEKREAVLAILKSKDAGMQKAFETVGTSDSGGSEGFDAEAKINDIAKNLRTAQPNLSPEQAYVAALDTPEGRELHTQLAG